MIEGAQFNCHRFFRVWLLPALFYVILLKKSDFFGICRFFKIYAAQFFEGKLFLKM
jgi:hypothetical protein